MPRAITFDSVKKIASAMPGVEDCSGPRGFGMKVGGKLLTCQAVNKSAEPNSLLVRMDFEQRDALIADAPETYYITDHYVKHPVVLVRLSRVGADDLRDLLHSAYRFVSGNKTRKRML